MTKRTIRIVLNEETFKKYKVYCALEDKCMTDQTGILIDKYLKECTEYVKIIRTSKIV